jgi:SPX domain protein involved in polyphosphate accumulation
MRFGHELEAQKREGWGEWYLDYKGLKKLIKKASTFGIEDTGQDPWKLC